MVGTKHKAQRVTVFVDIQNMYYSAKNLYKTKVNFKNVLRDAVAGRQLVRAFAYVIKTEIKEEKNSNYKKKLNLFILEYKSLLTSIQ